MKAIKKRISQIGKKAGAREPYVIQITRTIVDKTGQERSEVRTVGGGVR